MSRKAKIIIGVTLAVLVVGGTLTFVGYKQGWFGSTAPKLPTGTK